MGAFVGKKFPNITVDAMNEMGDTFKLNVLEEARKNNKKVVLFWYPKDFTFVCPTELHAFQEALPEFEKRNTIVIGASCDTAEVHFAWLNTSKDNGGIEGVTYPILADSNRNLSGRLGILDTTNETFDEGTVQHESINNMPLGRNVNEYLRIIDALTHVQKNGEVCPANWEEGKEAMQANAQGTKEYLSAQLN